MHILDQSTEILKLDPKGMYDLTVDFPAQCEHAFQIAQTFTPKKKEHFSNVIVTGMGGSAIGGDITRCLFEAFSPLPFAVIRDYTLPKSVGSNTLVFACSYSGNTEETLSAYQEAKIRGANIIAITSGGVLAENAKKDGFPVILIPSGKPPRTALGYLLIPTLVAASKLDLIPELNLATLIEVLKKCANEWRLEVPFEQNPSKQLAEKLAGNLGLIYGLGSWQGVAATRWKGQINENAKSMAFYATFPELNHNEILGWVGAKSQGVQKWVTVILEDGTESIKLKTRAKVTSELIHERTDVHRVKAHGTALLEKILSLIYFGDFVSLYLAFLNNVDPENIDWINHLKSELSKV